MSTVKLCAKLEAPTTDRICYKIASTHDERKQAFRIIYESYVESGLSGPNPYQMRVSPYHLLASTQMFVALLDGEVIFTASVVADGSMGLPMESVFPEEIAQRREQTLRLAEVTCLADRRARFRGSFPVFLRLCRLMFQYARRQQIDQLLIATHPRHARLYQRMLSFETIGEQKDYPLVQNRPAVPLILDFAKAKAAHPKNYDTFFGQKISDDLLRPQSITLAERDYFTAFVDTSYQAAAPVEAVC